MKKNMNNNIDLFLAAEINKPRKLIHKKDLRPINNLKIIFRDVRDYFAGNVTGITRDEKIAQNIMRLLFCKIYDEKTKHSEQLIDFANRPDEDVRDFANRITILFESVKDKYKDILKKMKKLKFFQLTYLL